MNPWLGAERGHLSDWTTQQWVRLTGRRVDLREESWLDGPWAPTTGIGARFFDEFAARHGLELGRADGLLPSFEELRSDSFDPRAVDPRIAEFYERTGSFRLQLWSQWSPLHRPFGRMIDGIFARRLGQLRLPLAPLDTSRGVSSELLSLRGRDGRTATPRSSSSRARAPTARSSSSRRPAASGRPASTSSSATRRRRGRAPSRR